MAPLFSPVTRIFMIAFLFQPWESSKKFIPHAMAPLFSPVTRIIMMAFFIPVFLSKTSCHKNLRKEEKIYFSFPPPLATLALGPSGLRSLASLGQSAHWALALNTRVFGRPEYCGIERGGIFFKDSLPFLDSLWLDCFSKIVHSGSLQIAIWNCVANMSLLVASMHRESFQQLQMWFSEHFLRQNVLRSLSRLLLLLRWNKYSTKKCLKNHIPFHFWDDSTSANQEAGKTIEKPLKEFPWNQQ